MRASLTTLRHNQAEKQVLSQVLARCKDVLVPPVWRVLTDVSALRDTPVTSRSGLGYDASMPLIAMRETKIGGAAWVWLVMLFGDGNRG